MAGGRGVSSSCQDRGWTRVGKKGEKLSNVTFETPLSAEESGMRRLKCARVCLQRCVEHTVLAGQRAGVRLLGCCVFEIGREGFLVR